MTVHLRLEWLSGYLDGRVSAEERRQVEAHLDACAVCRATLADLRRTVALVQDLEPVGAPAAFRTAVQERLEAERSAPNRGRRAWPLAWSLPARPTWRAALAAAAVLLIGLFSVNLWQEVSPRRDAGEGIFSRRAPSRAVDVDKSAAPAAESQFGRAQPVGVPGVPLPAAQVPGPGVARLPFERQVIRAATLQAQVPSFEDASKALVRIAESSGGFIADSTTSQEEPPYGTFVLRVPALRFSQTLDQIEALGKVTERRVRGQDVTEEFVDLQARIRNLEAHERQLLTFMERATRVADLLAIEQELSRVRGEIEQFTGRLRFLGNRVEMATIQVTLREKAKQSSLIFWDFAASLLKVRGAFLGTIRQFLAVSERLVVTLSALVPLILLGLAGWAVIRRLLRRGASAV